MDRGANMIGMAGNQLAAIDLVADLNYRFGRGAYMLLQRQDQGFGDHGGAHRRVC